MVRKSKSRQPDVRQGVFSLTISPAFRNGPFTPIAANVRIEVDL
jgi:hypothetical protein